MITRKQYLAGEFSHLEYYSQFVTNSVKARVLRFISKKDIQNSTDEHMNDIPLNQWDCIGITSTTGDQMRECGDYPTLAGSVCIHKQAAKQIKGES